MFIRYSKHNKEVRSRCFSASAAKRQQPPNRVTPTRSAAIVCAHVRASLEYWRTVQKTTAYLRIFWKFDLTSQFKGQHYHIFKGVENASLIIARILIYTQVHLLLAVIFFRVSLNKVMTILAICVRSFKFRRGHFENQAFPSDAIQIQWIEMWFSSASKNKMTSWF